MSQGHNKLINSRSCPWSPCLAQTWTRTDGRTQTHIWVTGETTVNLDVPLTPRAVEGYKYCIKMGDFITIIIVNKKAYVIASVKVFVGINHNFLITYPPLKKSIVHGIHNFLLTLKNTKTIVLRKYIRQRITSRGPHYAV